MGIFDEIEVATIAINKMMISDTEATIYQLSWSDRKYQMREMLPKINDYFV